MKVEVHNNNVQRAMRILGKKLNNENFWDEFKRHRHFEKPSVARRQKRLRKQLG